MRRASSSPPGRRPRTGGIIIAQGPREILDARLAADPFAKAGAADYDVTEFLARMTAADLDAFKEA